jgi:hypothetical protein
MKKPPLTAGERKRLKHYRKAEEEPARERMDHERIKTACDRFFRKRGLRPEKFNGYPI